MELQKQVVSRSSMDKKEFIKELNRLFKQHKLLNKEMLKRKKEREDWYYEWLNNKEFLSKEEK